MDMEKSQEEVGSVDNNSEPDGQIEESINAFTVTLEIDRNINFALQQNDVKFIKSLTITNNTAD